MKFRDELVKTNSGMKVSIHAGELNTAAAVEKLFSEVLAEHRKIDIVVNAVGMVLKKPTTTMSEAEYTKMSAYWVFVDEQRRRCVDQFHAEAMGRQRSSS